MKTKHTTIRIGVAFILIGLFMGSVMAAEEPLCDLADPVNVSLFVSPDTIMLDSNSPIFGIEVEDHVNITHLSLIGLVPGIPVEGDEDYYFPEEYSIYDLYNSDVEFGVIVRDGDKIFSDKAHTEQLRGEVNLEMYTRKPYEISPNNRLVLLYEKDDVFDKHIGFDESGNEVTVGDLLQAACADDKTGRVPFYIRGTFETGDHAGREFYGYNYADVMEKSQTESNGSGNGNGNGRNK